MGEEENRKKVSEDLFAREDDLTKRVLEYREREHQLIEERKEVERSKRKLATVQAHTMALLDLAGHHGQVPSVPISSISSFGPGVDDEGDTNPNLDEQHDKDGVYGEDWTLGFAPGPAAAVDSPSKRG